MVERPSVCLSGLSVGGFTADLCVGIHRIYAVSLPLVVGPLNTVPFGNLKSLSSPVTTL